VIPLAEGGDQRDWDLLQSLCQPHHRAMTATTSVSPAPIGRPGGRTALSPWRSQSPAQPTTNRKEPHDD
jgi:hypothetical protein